MGGCCSSSPSPYLLDALCQAKGLNVYFVLTVMNDEEKGNLLRAFQETLDHKAANQRLSGEKKISIRQWIENDWNTRCDITANMVRYMLTSIHWRNWKRIPHDSDDELETAPFAVIDWNSSEHCVIYERNPKANRVGGRFYHSWWNRFGLQRVKELPAIEHPFTYLQINWLGQLIFRDTSILLHKAVVYVPDPAQLQAVLPRFTERLETAQRVYQETWEPRLDDVSKLDSGTGKDVLNAATLLLQSTMEEPLPSSLYW